MRRLHLVELEDLERFPSLIRDAGVAYLRFAAERGGQAARMVPTIERALERSGAKSIVDLCSGAGGPVVAIVDALRAQGRDVSVTLTDLHPGQAMKDVAAQNDAVDCAEESVDATDVPVTRSGLRTLFNAFHHFRPDDGRRVLAAAVRDREPIAVVEVLGRSPIALFGMLFAPLIVLLVLPFLRPFRLGWLPFTYLLPVIPLFVMWDGAVSCLRIYTEAELLELAKGADPGDTMEWSVESIDFPPAPVPGNALVGIPRERLG